MVPYLGTRADPVTLVGTRRRSMTDTPAQAEHGCTDPHDHSGHDHPPTGADLLRELVQGLSILSLVIPALGVVLLLVILPMAPSTPVVLALGLALGAGHMLSLVATGLFVARTRKQLAVNPGLQAVRSAVEEALRVATILLALLQIGRASCREREEGVEGEEEG